MLVLADLCGEERRDGRVGGVFNEERTQRNRFASVEAGGVCDAVEVGGALGAWRAGEGLPSARARGEEVPYRRS